VRPDSATVSIATVGPNGEVEAHSAIVIFATAYFS